MGKFRFGAVTHDLDEAIKMGDRVAILARPADGRLVTPGWVFLPLKI